MLKLIGWTIKLTVFAVIVLVLGNWLQIDGKSISDQVKSHMSHAQRQAPHLKHSLHQKLTEKIESAREWSESNGVPTMEARNDSLSHSAPAPAATMSKVSSRNPSAKKQKAAQDEEIPPTERQKLRALIREL